MHPSDDPIKHLEDFVVAHRERLKEALTTLRDVLREERLETRHMLEIYERYSRGLATNEDMHHANQQFVELIRLMGLGVLLILPMAPLSIPLVVRLGHRLGIEVLPHIPRHGHGPTV
jgi:hypothetical protein